MDPKQFVGSKIKAYRTQNHLTLKQLSERVGLSVGFLSQVERGQTALSLNTMSKLATVLEVDISALLSAGTDVPDSLVVRGFERRGLQDLGDFIQYALCPDILKSRIYTEVYELSPRETPAWSNVFCHEQEEFIYVLEGALAIRVGSEEYSLSPGDGIRIPPSTDHSWINRTNHIIKLLGINLRMDSPKPPDQD